MTPDAKLTRIVEAIVFVADEPVSVEDLAESLNAYNFSLDDVRQALDDLCAEYDTQEHAIELRQVAGGYRFFTRTEYAPFVKQLFQNKERKKLSRAALETLAIIAYRQPVTKTDMELIRGVNCDYSVQKLVDKELIEPAGREDLPGRPLLYRTTPQFLIYFGLNTLSDLPKLTELITDEQATQEI